MIGDKKITLIGAGNLGSSLHHALNRKGYNSTLINRDLNAQSEHAQRSDVVLITVQDSKISEVCRHISKALRPKTVVAHCSGAMDCQVLSAAYKQGAYVASAHPLNTFPSREAGISLLSNDQHGSHCYLSGQTEATTSLSTLFSDLGFNTTLISDEAKLAYHTACVFACNYLTSLAEISLQTAELGNINRNDLWLALQPLMQATLRNISDKGTSQALSGPIARGDVETVKKHLQLLGQSSKHSMAAYRALGLEALSLAELDATDSSVASAKIKKLLS